MNKLDRKGRVIIFLPTIVLLLFVGFVVLFLFASGTIDAMVNGPKVIMEVESPDGQYMAYTVERPSLAPPNQSLMIERSDKSRFLRIAKLVGDVDSIEKILWSPDSSVVVFHSRLYLTIARVTDWSMVRIYLGAEWRRRESIRRTTFSGAMPTHEVQTIEFPEPGQVAYRLKGQRDFKIVRMNILPE